MITPQDIRDAQARILGIAYRTPLIQSTGLSSPGSEVYFKPENLQPIGSFKLRGAYNRIAAIPAPIRAEGVIAYSSGNHAQGVAYSAKQLGIKAVIVMPTNAPAIKIDATRGYGAKVVLYDPDKQNREKVAQALMQGEAWTLVPPFNDPYVIAGQGTIGFEIYEDLPEVDLIITPVGGGGLISGIAVALKSLKSNVRIIGVEPAIANDAQRSKRSGHIVHIEASQANQTLADGVRTLAVGDLTFEHIQRWVDDIVTVTEDEIRSAARHMILNEKLVAEPTGVLPLAAWLYHRSELPPATQTAMVISGGNIDPSLLAELVQER